MDSWLKLGKRKSVLSKASKPCPIWLYTHTSFWCFSPYLSSFSLTLFNLFLWAIFSSCSSCFFTGILKNISHSELLYNKYWKNVLSYKWYEKKLSWRCKMKEENKVIRCENGVKVRNCMSVPFQYIKLLKYQCAFWVF